MAICNLFKKIENKTGNFIMFSQYVEDLTKATTAPGYYRVIPSKFIAMDINYANKIEINKYDEDLNKAFPLFLQAEFENGCAVMRDNIDTKKTNDTIILDNKSLDHWSSSIFWNLMIKNNLLELSLDENNENNKIVKNIKYIGDINLQSYNEYDGMGYNEIYCFIPNDVSNSQYKLNITGDNKSIIINPTDNPEVLKESYLRGFTQNDDINMQQLNWTVKLPLIPETQNPIEIKYLYDNKYNFDSGISLNTDFQFNTIIILYDIYLESKADNPNRKPFKTNIPLGLYLTGIINNDGTVTNTHYKYVNNSDIYNTGTSYGLKICSRFISTPNADGLKIKNIEVDNTFNSLYCQLMSSMAETQAKMDEILKQLYEKDKKYNELYNIFKNNRTNVPYIKNVNGKQCWFVNGRNIGEIETGSSEGTIIIQ